MLFFDNNNDNSYLIQAAPFLMEKRGADSLEGIDRWEAKQINDISIMCR